MKTVTKEMAQKWLDKQIRTAKSMAIKLNLDKNTVVEICGVPRQELHIYDARIVQKLAEFLELPFEKHDPWHEQYPDNIEISFMYNGWRIFGLATRMEFYNEKTEVTD